MRMKFTWSFQVMPAEIMTPIFLKEDTGVIILSSTSIWGEYSFMNLKLALEPIIINCVFKGLSLRPASLLHLTISEISWLILFIVVGRSEGLQCIKA